MRIIGGEYRGKQLVMPDDKRIRPTADRTRESLFNILSHGAEYRTEHGPLPYGARVLDIFSGTGALGVEALSRGAAHVTFIDNHPDSLKIVRQNIASIQAQQKADILSRDGTNPGRAGSPVDLVLMDPPYSQALAEPCLSALLAGGWLHQQSITALELAAKEAFTCPAGYEQLDERRYGAAKIILLRRAA